MTTMGYEYQLFYGAAGAEASSRITNSRDVKYTFGPVMDDITRRGDATSPPLKESKPVAREVKELSWNMVDDPDDAVLTALRSAASTASLIAIRTKNRLNGKGFNGDVYIECDEGAPLEGRKSYDFRVSGVYQKLRAAALDA